MFLFIKVKGIQKVVIAERTEISLVNFEALQRFAVFELQLTVIPVIPDNLAVLLVQMVMIDVVDSHSFDNILKNCVLFM